MNSQLKDGQQFSLEILWNIGLQYQNSKYITETVVVQVLFLMN